MKQLLDDIWEWEKVSREKQPDADEFYCLKPFVIKADGGRYEVVDGQQRLTTILLILNHFNRRLVEDARKRLFSISFQTRSIFDALLEKPSQSLKNRRSVMELVLLLRTQVIWFELAEKDNPIDAFTRLNIGKIPFTDDELVRALFLRQISSNKTEDLAWQLKVANEWDQIEKALQNNAF